MEAADDEIGTAAESVNQTAAPARSSRSAAASARVTRACSAVTREAHAGPRIAFWVAVAVLISNIDRGNLATAAPLIGDELHLSAPELGILISCFFWSYTASIGVATWLAGRYGAYRVLGGCVAVWSVATASTGLAAGFVGLLLLRLLLGVGESGVFPCASSILASDAGASERGRANGMLAIAIAIGPAFGTLAGGLLMSRFGWRWVFVGLGVLSLAWLVPWLRLDWRTPRGTVPRAVDRPVPLATILRERALWGTLIGNVCGGYTYYFMISWMPSYLVHDRGLSIDGMAELIAAAYLVRAATSLASGRIIDYCARTGRSATVAYKSLMGSNQLAAVVCLAGIALASGSTFIGWLFVYEFFAGLSTTAGFAVVQTIAGPRATAPWVGVVNFASSSAGMVAPALTGFVIGATGHYVVAFGLAAAMALVGFVAWVFILPSVELQAWPAETESSAH